MMDRHSYNVLSVADGSLPTLQIYVCLLVFTSVTGTSSVCTRSAIAASFYHAIVQGSATFTTLRAIWTRFPQ